MGMQRGFMPEPYVGSNKGERYTDEEAKRYHGNKGAEWYGGRGSLRPDDGVEDGEHDGAHALWRGGVRGEMSCADMRPNVWWSERVEGGTARRSAEEGGSLRCQTG